MARKVSERLRCCICGEDTTDASDYVEMQLRVEDSEGTQFFGAHAEHLTGAMAPGFEVEVHLM